jgi:hypothetical protein
VFPRCTGFATLVWLRATAGDGLWLRSPRRASRPTLDCALIRCSRGPDARARLTGLGPASGRRAITLYRRPAKPPSCLASASSVRGFPSSHRRRTSGAVCSSRHCLVKLSPEVTVFPRQRRMHDHCYDDLAS